MTNMEITKGLIIGDFELMLRFLEKINLIQNILQTVMKMGGKGF